MPTPARVQGAAGVVVGAADSLEADAARRWALAEAAQRGVPLTLLRACGSSADGATTALTLLAEATRRCRQEAPDVPLRQLVTPGSAVDALVRCDADLVVVGAPDARRLDLVRGTVGARVAACRRTPVVVVRGDHGRDEASDWPVLAAVRVHPTAADDSTAGPGLGDDAEAVLALAAAAAHREGRPLVVLNAHQDLPPAAPVPVPAALSRFAPAGPGERSRALRHRRLREAVAVCEKRFPGLRIRVELADDAPDRALLERTAHAALVVVGVRRLRAGPVGRLLQHVPPVLPVGVPLEVTATWRSSCPVLLAPPGSVPSGPEPSGSERSRSAPPARSKPVSVSAGADERRRR